MESLEKYNEKNSLAAHLAELHIRSYTEKKVKIEKFGTFVNSIFNFINETAESKGCELISIEESLDFNLILFELSGSNIGLVLFVIRGFFKEAYIKEGCYIVIPYNELLIEPPVVDN